MIEIPEHPEHDATSAPAAAGADRSDFTCDVTASGSEVTVRVRGELDLATAPVLDREILAALTPGISVLILDLGGVGFLDSSGIASLIAARRDTRARDARFALGDVTRQCRMTIALSGLTQLFGLEDPPE
jgi:anti-sigma B factor antagonist